AQQQEVAAGADDLLGPLTVGGAAGDLHDRALLVGVLQPVEIVPDHQAEAEHEHAHGRQCDERGAASTTRPGLGPVVILPLAGELDIVGVGHSGPSLEAPRRAVTGPATPRCPRGRPGPGAEAPGRTAGPIRRAPRPAPRP